jgi:hypothetical protein
MLEWEIGFELNDVETGLALRLGGLVSSEQDSKRRVRGRTDAQRRS